MYMSDRERTRLAKGRKYFSTHTSCSSAVMAASAVSVVPRAVAVAGMNWIRPTALLPAALRTFGRKVPPDSNAMQAMIHEACS